MAFDLETAIQQGFNRDPSTNDWHVEANNLEIKLGDEAGSNEFRVLDVSDNNVVIVNSDGYMALADTLEVHGGNVLIQNQSADNAAFITLQDTGAEASIYLFNANPDGSVSGEKGSIGASHADGYFYINTNGSTKWERIPYTSQLGAREFFTGTLQQAYDNDPDGGNVTITTNATDGALIIAGTEKLQVTATGGFDLDTGFDMDGAGPFDVDITGAISLDSDAASNFTVAGADLTLQTTTSGDIIVRVPSGAGDFIVDEGAGTNYIQTNTSTHELLLGDSTGTTVDVRVLKDLTVEGDFVVNGTTTTVNTENLLVEDNLIRLNVNALPGFPGNTGIEAYLGSDGYAEFHWDDTDARWEISIDRSLTPSAQTFRPLAYLSATAATLDLSSTGTGGYPGPNTTAGASVVNTNSTNFPYTFGPDMADDSVQSALEAIDGYFVDVTAAIVDAASLTLQRVYDNDVDGAGATITTNSTDGAVIIAGTEKFQVTATNGLDLDTGFDMDGAGPFDVDITGAVSIDSDAASNFTVAGAGLTLSTTTSGTVTVDGASGVILDGNGNNVIPAANDTDSLGDSTHGWTTVYVRNVADNATVALNAAGTSGTPNTTSGAAVIGTDADNFTATFGGSMTSDTVQAALEAIDGYVDALGAFAHSIDQDVSALEQIFNDTNEPNGFVNRTDSTVSWSNVNRRLTIQPASSSYDIYIADLGKVTKTGVETVDITDTEGLWYIYFNGSAVLTASQTFDPRIISEWAFVAVVYWNATDNQEELFGEERHGITMDGVTHSYLHNVLGAQWRDGLGLGGFNIDGDGTNNNQAQFLVGNGSFYDEDIRHIIEDDTPQDLDPIANIPVYYKTSASGDWRKKTSDNYSVIYNGSVSGYSGTRIAYNENTGSTWQLTEASEDGYVLMHYFATNDFDEPIVAICGENEYATIETATTGILSEFNTLFTDGLPGPEFAPLATVIWNTSSSYSNTPKAIIVSDVDGNSYKDWRLDFTDRTGSGGTAISDHGNLAGLLDDDHTQYLLADGTRSLTNTWDAAFAITTPEINYTGTLSLDGSSGITLEGNGGDVIPTTTNTDSLGDSTHAWTTVYVQNIADTSVVALSDAGGASAPNTTSGAAAIGTNASNFTSTFGGDMTANTVQAALEAIDGYMQELTVGFSTVTLQIAYKNDTDGSDAIITTDSVDGAFVIAGTEKLQVTATGGFDLDTGFDMDGSGPFDVDITGAVSIDSDAASNFTVDGANLTLSTTTSGTVIIDGVDGITLDANNGSVDPGGDRTDDLGSTSLGWKEIYISDVNGSSTVALGGTSGATAVGTDSANFDTFGSLMTEQSVEGALEAIDGYLAALTLDDLDTTFTQTKALDINGAVLSATTRITTVSGTPAIAFRSSLTSRASWSIPVPSDWDGVSNIVVPVVWSQAGAGTGNVEWRLEYKSLALTELASAAATNVDYTQAASGTTDAIQSTTINLVIPAAAISVTDEIIVINVVRRGSAAGDTYAGDANVHLVKYSYTAENIVG